jgi:ketosteroid isomerase-like protein
VNSHKGEFFMSTEQNIQIAAKGYADFSRGDIPAVLAALDENVEWITPDIGMPPGGTYKGRAGVGQFFQQVNETWDFKSFEPRDYIASGDQVAVVGAYTALSRKTGRTVSCDWVMVWKIKDGKVIHFQEYTDSAALRDVLTLSTTA